MTHYLYLHFPFCVSKCRYCDFYSVPFDKGITPAYVAALRKEMALKAHAARGLEGLYLGGGTPSLLSGPELASLMKDVAERYGFAAGAEITLEANPGTVSKEKLEAFRAAGINRLSIGIQSLDDRELRLLGRCHTATEGSAAVEAAREAGFDNLSLDLLYGIPGQSREGWRRTLAEVIALRPEHISAYELTPEEGTPLFESIRKGETAMPGEEEGTALYYQAIDTLAAAGYEQYEISNFSLPGFRCRHNLNYWNRGAYLGIGAAAHSFDGTVRTANARSVHAYLERLTEGELPVEEETAIDGAASAKERIFLGLRKTEGIDLDAGAQINRKAAEELLLRGLIELSGHRLRLTRKGLVLSSEVMLRLMEP